MKNSEKKTSSKKPEKRPVVNVDCEINDGISPYRTIKMTASVEFLNGIIDYCKSKKEFERDEKHKILKDILFMMFLPMQEVHQIQSSIIMYIFNDDTARQKFLKYPEGGFNIHLNINLEEYLSTVSFEGADFPEGIGDKEFRFIPYMEIGDSDIVCTPSSGIDLLVVTDAFFFRSLISFMLENGQPEFNFTLEQLKGFLFGEKPNDPQKRIIKILENCKFYKLIEYEQLIEDNGQVSFEVLALNFDYYKPLIKGKKR